jgi:hypothetical protein
MHSYVKEENSRNKEQALGALSSFLRGEYFDGKRDFLKKNGGMEYLFGIMKDESTSLRSLKKAYFLMHDLIMNDERIFENNPTFIKDILVECPPFRHKSHNLLDNIELKNYDLRRFALMNIGAIEEYRSGYVGDVEKEKLKAQ